MITIFWYDNGVRVVRDSHTQFVANHMGQDVVVKEFKSVEDALAILAPTNRAVPILRCMKETAK